MSLAMRNMQFLRARGAQWLQSRGYADEMKLTFAAANKVFYHNTEVRQIDVPTFSGSFGILAKHVPTLAVLKPGIVQVYENDGKTSKVFVSSGTVTVNEDSSVQVLAEEAHNIEDIDAGECRQLLAQFEQKLSSSTTEQDKAEASIGVEVCQALVKAVE